MTANNSNKYLALIAPYSLCVSALYLFGYWGTFEINIFEYIGLADILKVAISQLAGYGLFIILGLLFSEIFITPLISKSMPPGQGVNTPEGRFLRKYSNHLLALLILFCFYIILFTVLMQKWFLVAFLLSPVITLYVYKSAFLLDVIKNDSVRNFLILCVVNVLLFSFSIGKNEAFRKKENGDSLIIINNVETSFNYLGKTGEYFFYWERNTKEVNIISLSEIKNIRFKLKEPKKPFSFSFFLRNS